MKQSSYQKLKEKCNRLYNLYHRARKELNELGVGVQGDDTIMEFDCYLPNINKMRKISEAVIEYERIKEKLSKEFGDKYKKG